MRFIDGVSAAAYALRANILRSALTTLGIVIGVGAVVAMIGIGTGAERQIEKAIESIGSNLLVVGNGSGSVRGRQRGRGSLLTLTEQDAAALAREIPSVELAAGSVAGVGRVVFGNKNWPTTVRGVTPEYFSVRNWVVGFGRKLARPDVQSAATVAILGASVAERLFYGTSPINQTIRIERVPFTVIGVMRAKGPAPWGSDQDDVVFVPLGTAKRRLFGDRQFRRDLLGQVTVKTSSIDSIHTVEEQIIRLLRKRHKLRTGEDNDFFVRNVAEVLEARADSSRVMSVLLASVAAISLLVGGIGIMNMMLVSVTERTREIGLRMAVGARRGDIRVQFMTEALLLSVVGGLIGMAAGIGGSVLISDFFGWPVEIGFKALSIAVIFSGAVGIIFGYYPARQAARMDPINALRQE